MQAGSTKWCIHCVFSSGLGKPFQNLSSSKVLKIIHLFQDTIFSYFQHLLYWRKWRHLFKELVADTLSSLFPRTNSCGNDQCIGCIVQLKEASKNRRTERLGGSRDATARHTTVWHIRTKLMINQLQAFVNHLI